MHRSRGSRLGFSFVAALATIVAAHGTSTSGGPQSPATDPRCGWTPPQTSITRTARNMDELRRLVADAKPGTTILLEEGEYRLDRMLDISTERVVIRGRSGDRGKVIVRGDGMQEPNVGVALSISASHVTLADLTVGYVRFHGVQVRGERGASNVVLQNIRVVNTGQQLIKGSVGSDGRGPDDGLLACSLIDTPITPRGTIRTASTSSLAEDGSFATIGFRGFADPRIAATPAPRCSSGPIPRTPSSSAI